MMTKPEIRRFPITLRELEVVAVSDLTPRLRRITLGGAEIGEFESAGGLQPSMQSLGPDDHVKLFFPDPDNGTLSLPEQGDGRLRWPESPPAISREYTPRAFDARAGKLVLDFVLHGHGIAGSWAESAQIGQRIHVAGPKASMLLPVAARYILLGDETAIPAIGNWLEMLPADAQVEVHILVGEPSGKLSFNAPEHASIQWHNHDPTDTQAFVGMIATPTPDSFIWAAGERGSISALREHLQRAGHPGERVDLSNYWTLGEVSEE